MENPNNRMIAAGRLTAAPQLSHEVMNEPFYSAILQVKRLSGALDSIPLTLPGKLLVEGQPLEDTLLLVQIYMSSSAFGGSVVWFEET